METEESYGFRIFVTGNSPRSQRAVENLRELCGAVLDRDARIEVVDVLSSPERAEAERVLATPTVLRLSPSPVRRVIGDLADFGLAASALGLPRLQARRSEPSRSCPGHLHALRETEARDG